MTTATITIGTDKQIDFAVKTQAVVASKLVAACDELIAETEEGTVGERRLADAVKARILEVLATEQRAGVWLDTRGWTSASDIAGIILDGDRGHGLTAIAFPSGWVAETQARIAAEIAAEEAELAAAEAEVDAAETVEAAEVAAQEDAIEIVSEAVTTTLELYRHTVRCTVCRMRTKSKCTSIRHYTDCAVAEQSTELLETLRAAQAVAAAKRKATRLAKAEAALEAAHQAVAEMNRKIGGSLLGIHKVYGSTGIHTVRSAEGTCTCPGHKRHGHCKHVPMVRETKEQIAATRKEIARLSTWIIAQVERATLANSEW